jgi:hypothetical protein
VRNQGGVMAEKRKPFIRKKDYPLQARLSKELGEKLDAMIAELAGVKNSNKQPLTKTDLVVYWLDWLTGQAPEERQRWARAYRDWFLAAVRAEDAPEPSGAKIKGGHTVGRVRSLDDDVEPGKPGRPKRNKMDAQAAR